MKVPASSRKIYDDQFEINTRLREVVTEKMLGLKHDRWHYESRIKEPASFHLKIESGRFKPNQLEDFFACTLVVANSAQLETAEAMVYENFDVQERRPKECDKTHKGPDSFPFDDLRLYAKLLSGPSVPERDINHVLFEIQIKTFLQHAWAIATHDLIYKEASPSWSKSRIAYQVKAMLEHAEVSIEEAETLSACLTLAKEDRKTTALRDCVTYLQSNWSCDELPENTRGLAQNIDELLYALHLSHDDLKAILDRGKSERSGNHPKNLSPYGVIIQYLLALKTKEMRDLLNNPNSRKKILLPSEVDIPSSLDRSRFRNAIFI